jgi:hypothetical protein
MALIDLKFEESDFVDQDVSSLPDQVASQAAFLKARIDNVPKNMIALGRFNSLVDALVSAVSGSSGAKQVGMPRLTDGAASNMETELKALNTAARTGSMMYIGTIPTDYASVGAAVAAGQGLFLVFNYSGMPGSNKYGLMTVLNHGSYTAVTYYPVGSPTIFHGSYNGANWFGWYRQDLVQYVTFGASDEANVILTPGVYKCVGVTTANHFAYTGGVLEVIEANGYIMQRMTDVTTMADKKRLTANNGTTWTSWV